MLHNLFTNPTFTVDPGATVTVTFNNTKNGTIIVNKQAIGGDAQFNFTTTGGDGLPASFNITTVSGNGTQTFNDILPGNYGVTENVAAGWVLTSSSSSTGTPSAFSVAPGSTVTVNFTNSLPPASKITPTGTTCSDFTSGTAQTLAQLNYSVKAGAILQVDPGVFFYFTNVTLTAPTNIINVTQSNLLNWKPIQPKIGQISLYNSACTKVSETSSINSTNGTATMNTSVPTGSYVVQIQYDSTSIKGQTVSTPLPTDTYFFQTDINSIVDLSTKASIKVVPK